MSDHPFQIPEQEQQELDRLGAELRDAMPTVHLDEDFHERLAVTLQDSWTFRSALQNNGMIRMAAGLLVMTLAAAPVAAWVGLWPSQKQERPSIGFELPEELDIDQSGGTLGDSQGHQVVGPNDEFEVVEWTPERRVALERYNRLVSAVAFYEGQALSANAPIASAWGESQPWANATDEILWQEFERRCASADLSPLPSELVARCEAMLAAPLAADAPKQQRIAYAAWSWLLDGEQAADQDLPVAWQGAPFLLQD
ncbi:MAG: hypothetical protein QF489_07845 [Planctomycetota bacterium]|nr:hypothetical protein [Planctomycetota bacterium]